MSQVHKENLSFVENAIEGRQGLTPEVFGMMGIPEDLIEARNQRIYNEFFKNEAEHRARTGNPPPGQKQGEPNSKRRKFEESLEDMQARKAAHRAKRAAERQAREEGKSVAQSASSAPDAVQGQGHVAPDANPVSLSVFQSHVLHTNATEQVSPPNFQPPYDQMQSYGPQSYASQSYAPQSYAPQPYAAQPGLPMHPPSASGFPSPFPVAQPGQWPSHSSPTSFSSPQAAPYAAPPFPTTFSPPQVAPYAAPPFRYPVHSPMTGQMSGSMMPSYYTQHTPNPLSGPQSVTAAQTSLQPAPGLPARPSLEVPTPNRDVMQRMHSGQVPLSNNNTTADQHHNIVPRKRSAAEEASDTLETMLKGYKKVYKQEQAEEITSAFADAWNELASDRLNEAFAEEWAEKEAAAERAEKEAAKELAAKEANMPAPATASKEKKKKSKPDSYIYVYSDNSVGPEEKMAKWSRYTFTF